MAKKRIHVRSASTDGRSVRIRIAPSTSEDALRSALATRFEVPTLQLGCLQDSDGCIVPMDYPSLDDDEHYTIQIRSNEGVAEEGVSLGSASLPRNPSGDRLLTLYLKTLQGGTHTVHIAATKTVDDLKLLIGRNSGMLAENPGYANPELIRLIFAGSQLEDGRSMSDYRIAHQSTLHVITRLRGDIGEWVFHKGSLGVDYIMSSNVLQPQMLPRAMGMEIVRHLGATTGSTYELMFNKGAPLFTSASCKSCIDLLESRCPADVDFKLEVSQQQATSLLGSEVLERLLALHPDGPSARLLLRRTVAHDACIYFHIDVGSKRTVQVALNGDDEYQGGRLCYITANGLQVPSRPKGCAIVHDNKIVHAVSRLIEGKRYGLFVLDRERL